MDDGLYLVGILQKQMLKSKGLRRRKETKRDLAGSSSHQNIAMVQEESSTSSSSTDLLAYQYKPLLPNEIRLIRIPPRRETEILRIDLFHSKLRKRRPNGKNAPDHINYTALSYTWGDALETAEIQLSGRAFTIRRNLRLALTDARDQAGEENLVIWADAICINQADLAERAEQVRRMRTIYARAEKIVAWLGQATDDSALAMEWAEELYDFMATREAMHGSVYAVIANMSESDVLGPAAVKKMPAIHRLFQRDWWFRTWVLQEATSEPPVTLVCGSKAIPWRAVGAACFILTDLSMRPGYEWTNTVGVGGPNRINSFHLWRRAGPIRRHLLTLLQMTRKSESSDLRDKVYAMLSFASDLGQDDIVPDYYKSVEQLYIDVARWALQKYNNLDLLGHCAHEDDGKVTGLPSWVPDWSDRAWATPFTKIVPSSGDSFSMSDPHAYKPCYDADSSYASLTTTFVPPQHRGATEPCYRVVYTPDSPLPILVVSGLFLSRISCLRDVVTDYQEHSEERSWDPMGIHIHHPIGEGLPNIEGIPHPRDPLTGESVHQTFLHTLVADARFGSGGIISARGNKMVFPEHRGLVAHSHFERQKEQKKMAAMKEHTVNRRMFYTDNISPKAGSEECVRMVIVTAEGTAMIGEGGCLMGLGPHHAKVGDEMFVFKGGKVLYVLRPIDEEESLANATAAAAPQHAGDELHGPSSTAEAETSDAQSVERTQASESKPDNLASSPKPPLKMSRYSLSEQGYARFWESKRAGKGQYYIPTFLDSDRHLLEEDETWEVDMSKKVAERPVSEDAARRPGGQSKRYTFVGECYVHGMMDGEALRMLERRKKGSRDRVFEGMAEDWRELLIV